MGNHSEFIFWASYAGTLCGEEQDTVNNTPRCLHVHR